MCEQRVELDPTSDSCAVLVWCTSSQAEALGQSIAGSAIECDGNACYAVVGMPRSDDHTDAEHDRCWRACVVEIESAGLDWTEEV